MTLFFVMHLREANLGLDTKEDNDKDVEQKIEALIKMKTKVDDLVDKNIKVMY